MLYLSFIDPERGEFGEIFLIITEGNISPNSPSKGSINDILYQKTKMLMKKYKKKIICKKPCHSFIKIFHAFFSFLQIPEGSGGLNSKFC